MQTSVKWIWPMIWLVPWAVDRYLAERVRVVIPVRHFRWMLLRDWCWGEMRLRRLWQSRWRLSWMSCWGDPWTPGAQRAVCRSFCFGQQRCALKRQYELCRWGTWCRVFPFRRSRHRSDDLDRTLGPSGDLCLLSASSVLFRCCWCCWVHD